MASIFTPTSFNTAIGPYAIDGNDCIGDSVGVINANTNYLASYTTAASANLVTQVINLSSQSLLVTPGVTLKTVTNTSSTPLTLTNGDGAPIWGPGNLTTIPTTSNGKQIITLTITPTYNNSKIVGNINIPIGSTSTNRTAIIAFFRNNETNAFAATSHASPYGAMDTNIHVSFIDTVVNTNPITYKVRVAFGGGGNGSIYINQTTAGETIGGLLKTCFTVAEIKA